MSELFIFRGVDFELGHSDYLSTKDKTGISLKLNEKAFSLSKDDFSYRIINHWEKNDLLTNSRETGKGWRKYSIMDKVWLYIVKDMRNFGISLTMIQLVKKSITLKSKSRVIFPLLEYYVSLALTGKPVFLIVFENGQASPVIEKEYQANREYSSVNNHLQINLNNLLQKVFPEIPVKSRNKEFAEPSLNERKAIQLLRLGSVKKVSYIGRDGHKQQSSLKSALEGEAIVELLFRRNYRQMELQLANHNLFNFDNENLPVI